MGSSTALLPLLLLSSSAAIQAALPPFVEQLAPGVWAGGFADRQKSANVGWYTTAAETILVSQPAGTSFDAEAVAGLTGKPVSRSQSTPGLDQIVPGCYFHRASGVLFAGDLITNGPHAPIPSDSAAWLAHLDKISQLPVKIVVPGRGSWGSPALIERQRRFVSELRRQVSYAIAMERPLESIQREILLPANYYVWMPYDLPTRDDIAALHREFTVPNAPFNGAAAHLDPARKHALVLIGDRYHEPEHFIAGFWRPCGRSPTGWPGRWTGWTCS